MCVFLAIETNVYITCSKSDVSPEQTIKQVPGQSGWWPYHTTPDLKGPGHVSIFPACLGPFCLRCGREIQPIVAWRKATETNLGKLKTVQPPAFTITSRIFYFRVPWNKRSECNFESMFWASESMTSSCCFRAISWPFSWRFYFWRERRRWRKKLGATFGHFLCGNVLSFFPAHFFFANSDLSLFRQSTWKTELATGSEPLTNCSINRRARTWLTQVLFLRV